MKKTIIACTAICVWFIQPTQAENRVFSKEPPTLTQQNPNSHLYGKTIVTYRQTSSRIVAENGKKIHLPPILHRIAFCESSGRHYLKDGSVLRGTQVVHDVGLFQINTTFHGAFAKKRGLDLYTIEGNARFAKYLLKTRGTSPWRPSKHCWNRRSSLPPSH